MRYKIFSQITVTEHQRAEYNTSALRILYMHH